MFVESLNIIVANLPTFLIYYNVTQGFNIITNYSIKVVGFGGNHADFIPVGLGIIEVWVMLFYEC